MRFLLVRTECSGDEALRLGAQLIYLRRQVSIIGICGVLVQRRVAWRVLSGIVADMSKLRSNAEVYSRHAVLGNAFDNIVFEGTIKGMRRDKVVVPESYFQNELNLV